MPEISRFYGIIIQLFFKDHAPPHFHAKYGSNKCKIDIRSGDLIDGKLPRKQLILVQAWTELHRNELMSNYYESHKNSPKILKIKPLK